MNMYREGLSARIDRQAGGHSPQLYRRELQCEGR